MAKKKEMNRTSGTAKRKAPNTMSASERIGRQRQAESANPGPRDKFNPAAAQGVVDTFGVGVNSSGKFEFNPITTLGMALPVGKLFTAMKALRGAGKIAKAAAVESRLLAKRAGAETARTGGSTINDVAMRNQSTSVFPRSSATKARTAPNRILEMQGQKRAARYTDMDRVNDFMSGYPTSRAEARAFGRAAAKGGQKVRFGAVNPLFKKTRGK
jgi:hypothetical protein